jgi:hypothetical protein
VAKHVGARGDEVYNVSVVVLMLQVVVTISQGKVVFEGGKLTVVAGAGRYVPRPLHPPIFQGVAQHNALRLSEEFPYGQTPVRRQGDAKPARDEL